MPIELHAFDTPNGRKISVALEEMELPYAINIIDIRKGDQSSPEFLKISPNGKIPAIIDPEGPHGRRVSIFESGAILIYLGAKTGKFWPADLEEQIPVLEWLMFQMGGFGPFPGQVHHFVTVENESDRRYALERYSKETRRLYGVMDRTARRPGVFRKRAVDRRLRDPRMGVAASQAQGRPCRFSERPALVRGDDGASRRPARICGEIELTHDRSPRDERRSNRVASRLQRPIIRPTPRPSDSRTRARFLARSNLRTSHHVMSLQTG